MSVRGAFDDAEGDHQRDPRRYSPDPMVSA